MPLKDILLSFSNGRTSDTVLEFGLALAGQADAAVTAMHVTPPIMEENQFATWMPDDLMAKVKAANAHAPTKAHEALQADVENFGYEKQVRWITESGDVADCLATQARSHDLLLIGKFGETTEETGNHVRSEQIVTRSGRPLMVVPTDFSPRPVKEAVIAWDGGPTAARALYDAIHLLPDLENVHIVSVALTANHPNLLENTTKYLSNHGIASTETILAPNGNAANQVLAYCSRSGADLLIVGSRGTTRLRSGFVLGGTGRILVENAEIPVLVSH